MDPGASNLSCMFSEAIQGRTPVVARQGVKSPCSLPPKTLLEPRRTSDQAEARNLGYTSSYRLPRLLAIVDSIDAARPLS